MEVQVQKKDGNLESFDRNKISQSLKKAGATEEQSENIASHIEEWVSISTVTGVIGSTELRNKVINMLKSVNPEAAESYESYRQEI